MQQLFWRWEDIIFGRLFPLVWLAHSFRKGVFAELVIEDSLREPKRNVTIAFTSKNWVMSATASFLFFEKADIKECVYCDNFVIDI